MKKGPKASVELGRAPPKPGMISSVDGKFIEGHYWQLLDLLMVISISVVSIFADDIAVEHPGRNLQDTRDVWHIDYEPRKAAPFSDECDTRYQKVSLTTLRRWDANGTNALSPTRVADNNSFYEDILVVTEFIELQDRYGVTLASDLVTLETIKQ